MADDEQERLAQMGATLMESQVLARGVSVAAVKDGTILYMSDEFLEGMLKKAREHPERRVLVFVKHSQPLTLADSV